MATQDYAPSDPVRMYQIDARPRSHLGVRVLESLNKPGASDGLCPCVLASNSRVAEPILFHTLSHLLAYELVEISVADPPPRKELVEVNERTTRFLEEARAEAERLDIGSTHADAIWLEFFKRVEALSQRPRYYVALTTRGRRLLKRVNRGRALDDLMVALGFGTRNPTRAAARLADAMSSLAS